jgi:purine nucleosidase
MGTIMKLIIDCDPGVDDALALILAARHPEAEILAVTTVAGNVGVDTCARNARFVLGLVGLDVPVVTGAPSPLRRELRDASETHGGDGLGGITGLRHPDGSPRYALPSPTPSPSQAVEAICDLVASHPGEIVLVATGPLTNLARLIRERPGTLGSLARLVIMGGAYRVRGNVRPWAEFNFWCDPDAAAIVLAHPIEKTLVGLDVTHQVVLGPAVVERDIRPVRTPAAEFVCDATEAYAAFDSRTYGIDGNYIHDAVAVAAALEPSIVETGPARVTLETEGERAGRCNVEHGPANADVGMYVDATRVLTMLQRAVAGRGAWP